MSITKTKQQGYNRVGQVQRKEGLSSGGAWRGKGRTCPLAPPENYSRSLICVSRSRPKNALVSLKDVDSERHTRSVILCPLLFQILAPPLGLSKTNKTLGADRQNWAKFKAVSSKLPLIFSGAFQI